MTKDTKKESLLEKSSGEGNHRGHDHSDGTTSPRLPLDSTSAFASFDWPNVWDESNDMCLCSIILYGVVDLRTLARKGLLTGGDPNVVEKLLTLPISARDIVQLVSQNKSAIKKEIGEESTELYLNAFDSMQGCKENALELIYNDLHGETTFASFDLAIVDDLNAQTELVYGICVHGARRRITVVFRGCTTRKDWVISADPFQSEHPNPVVFQNQDEQEKYVSIHHGFYSYLLQESPAAGKKKYEAIIDNVRELLKQYPGYQVYVTGHSLGGALATVFAFETAASQKLEPSATTITCISIASPMVGNLSFETTFKELEAQGRIRCLRVTNHFDVFTELPDRGAYLYSVIFCWGLHLWSYLGASCLFFACCQNRVYRHVGMDLHLYRNGRYKFKNVKGSSKNYCWRVAQDWKKHVKQTLRRLMTFPFVCFCDCCCLKEDFNTNHGVKEHMKRLNDASIGIKETYLNELYTEKRFDIV